ncbi:hypothetical protein BgiMline_029393, partial [Biomphalaria glabrata]
FQQSFLLPLGPRFPASNEIRKWLHPLSKGVEKEMGALLDQGALIVGFPSKRLRGAVLSSSDNSLFNISPVNPGEKIEIPALWII